MQNSNQAATICLAAVNSQYAFTHDSCSQQLLIFLKTNLAATTKAELTADYGPGAQKCLNVVT